MTTLKNSRFYRIGRTLYPSADLDEGDVMNTLTRNGFLKKNIKITSKNVPEAKDLGYESIILVHAFDKVL